MGHVGVFSQEIEEVLRALKEDFRDPDTRGRLDTLLRRLPPRETGKVKPGDWVTWVSTYGKRYIAQVTHSPDSMVKYQKRALRYLVRGRISDPISTVKFFYEPATKYYLEQATGTKRHHLLLKVNPPDCCRCKGEGTGVLQDRKGYHNIDFYCIPCGKELGGIGADDEMELL